MKWMSNYLVRHIQAAIYSLGQFSRAPIVSFTTCLIIGIALALPTALFVGLKNLANLGSNLQQTVQMTVYLKLESKAADAMELTRLFEANPAVRMVKAISPAEGLQELQQKIGMEVTSTELPQNPLPWVLVVSPKSARDLASISQTAERATQVESIQLDQLWVKRLATLVSVALRVVYALAIFLGIGVFLIINNVIRSATQQNHKEIKIINLIGGTYSFIRRPFLYAGMLYGFLGGIIAWQLVDILLMFLKKPILHLANLYNSPFQLLGIGLSNTLILLGISLLLGLMASWLAVTRYLKSC